MQKKPFQRIGSKSNTQVGDDFENSIMEYFTSLGLIIDKSYSLELGVSTLKNHRFDLGNDNVIIECKNHRWTETDKVPSSKIRAWNEAMYYFYIAPREYNKYFVVIMDYSPQRCKTLLEYYIEKYQFLIPKDVVLYEYYEEREQCEVYKYDNEKNGHIRVVSGSD